MKKLLFSYLLMMLMIACDGPDPAELYFVGDSHVARWDVKQWFAAYVTHNDGISGSGIDYIEGIAGKYSNHDVVVVIGTNDLWSVAMGDEDRYAERYVNAIQALSARHVYLFSIFPRGQQSITGDQLSNQRIATINAKVRERALAVANVTYVDVFDDLLHGEYISGQYTYDGLHLSDEGYEIITNKLKKQL